MRITRINKLILIFMLIFSTCSPIVLIHAMNVENNKVKNNENESNQLDTSEPLKDISDDKKENNEEREPKTIEENIGKKETPDEIEGNEKKSKPVDPKIEVEQLKDTDTYETGPFISKDHRVFNCGSTLVETIPEDKRCWKLKDLFPDPNLQKAIKNHFERYNRSLYHLLDTNEELITKKEMSDVWNLNASNLGIRDLTGLGYLYNLRQLYLSNNEIHSIPREAVALHKLGRLDLSGNDLRGANFASLVALGAWKKLTYLNLESTKIQNIKFIQFWKNLWNLNISNNRIADLSPLANLEVKNRTLRAENQIIDLGYRKGDPGLCVQLKLRDEDGNIPNAFQYDSSKIKDMSYHDDQFCLRGNLEVKLRVNFQALTPGIRSKFSGYIQIILTTI